MSDSWVTMITVCPCSARPSKTRMISSDVVESRFPVGSSARRIDGWLHERARDRDALALTAGELVRPVMDSVSELNALECFRGSLSPLVRSDAGVNERQLDVVQRGRARQQVEGLEHEADLAISDARELVLVLVGNELAGQPVFAGVGSIEAADEVHQSRLSGAGWSHDGDVLVSADGDVDAAERVHDFAAHVVITLEPARDNDPVLFRRGPGHGRNRLPLSGRAERYFVSCKH